MFKNTPTPLNPEQQRVYNIMLGKAYRMINEIYTTADLLNGIENTLNASEKRRLGRRFNRHTKKKPSKFTIIPNKKGNTRYQTKP